MKKIKTSPADSIEITLDIVAEDTKQLKEIIEKIEEIKNTQRIISDFKVKMVSEDKEKIDWDALKKKVAEDGKSI